MRKGFLLFFLAAVLAAVSACEEDPVVNAGTMDGDVDGDGDGDSDGNNPDQVSNADGCESLLKAIIRDFPESHPDFHHDGSSKATTGMVEMYLDANTNKPIQKSGEMYSTHLDEWYETISGVNQEFSTFVELQENDEGKWVFDSRAFFPLSPQTGYGADIPGETENFLFTTELSLEFIYEEGQTFQFRGDDDLWVFINGKLAIDLGGIHSPVEQEVNIQLFSNQNGFFFEPGQKVPMNIFHAERNPTQSNFRIETTIGCFNTVVVK